MPPAIPSLSVVMPAHNEAPLIHQNLLLLSATLEKHFSDYEIILVDDHSTDETPAVLEKVRTSVPHVIILSNTSHRGMGTALRTGLSAATKDLVFYTDADMPLPYDQIIRSVNALISEDAVAVMGKRSPRAKETVYRAICSLVYNWLIAALYGIRQQDISFAAKLIRRDVLKTIPLRAGGGFISAEIALRLACQKVRMVPLAMPSLPRAAGTSKMGSFREIAWTAYEMFRYRQEIRNSCLRK